MRTALFAWLCARSSGGSFILRIEDTDRRRRIEGSEEQILESLRWLGLLWDEGPEVGGGHGPYLQSERLELYRAEGERLAAASAAYWCTCTPERLERMRSEQRAAAQPTRYDRRCLARQDEVAAERESGAPAVLRQLMPPGRAEWQDVVRGTVTFDNAGIDDSVLLKADGFPTYHLAVVVDDHLMEITDVIRAEEWIPSTPKHLALYAALAWEPPRFAHVPLVLGEDRSKLSKRRGAPDILELRDRGYVAPALDNAMALLGWSSGTEEEVFDLAELCERFSLERVHPAPAVLDSRRLDDLNGIHLRRMDEEVLVEELRRPLPDTDATTRRALAPLLRERMVRLTDATVLAAPLLGEAIGDEGVSFPPRKVDAGTAAALLDAAIAGVEEGALSDTIAFRERLTHLLEQRGVKARDGMRVLYIAVLGRPAGLPVFDAMAFIGAEASRQRLEEARRRLEGDL